MSTVSGVARDNSAAKIFMQNILKRREERLASLSESERRAIAQREERAKQYFLRDVDGTSVEVIPERKRT